MCAGNKNDLKLILQQAKIKIILLWFGRTWSKFVDCINGYIDRCFTETRRHQFNKAVENPVDSVYQMCTSTSYQQEYLQHATCLKSTLTEDAHCGKHYKQLVAQVQGPREMGRSDLCW